MGRKKSSHKKTKGKVGILQSDYFYEDDFEDLEINKYVVSKKKKRTIEPKYTDVNELPEMCGHVSVRLDHYMLVFGGSGQTDFHSMRNIYLHNLDNDRWIAIRTPDSLPCPDKAYHTCGVAIDEVVYIFGGGNYHSSSIWTLSRIGERKFTWKEIEFEDLSKALAPRSGHCAWVYDAKMWTFGGISTYPGGTLNTYVSTIYYNSPYYSGDICNQLAFFDPETHSWTDLESKGDVPTPRAYHAAAAIGNRMWIYGGHTVPAPPYLDEMYELNMDTLKWKRIDKVGAWPPASVRHTLTAMNDHELVLHGGMIPIDLLRRTYHSDTWIFDLRSTSWSKYTGLADHARYDHTATRANDDILIIGGRESMAPNAQLCDIHRVFPKRRSPRRLEQLAVECVHEHMVGTLEEGVLWPYLHDRLLDM